MITLGNLRGLRESGNIFAIPTYLFVFGALLMIALGAYRIIVLGDTTPPPSPIPGAPPGIEPLTIFLLLRAFAGGSVALTGTEAIANGVPAFKKPEAKNAATTLTWMAILLGVLFVGITFLATNFGIVPTDTQTVIAQVSSRVYGVDSIGFYLFQAFTALILILAANTSYNAFPRLAAILAQDNFMPRQFAFRGDRLAYTLGIAILAGHGHVPAVGIRRGHPQPDSALLDRRLRELHVRPRQGWFAIGDGPAATAGDGAWRSTPSVPCSRGSCPWSC